MRILGLGAIPLMFPKDSRASDDLHEEVSGWNDTWAVDDHSGEALDPDMVKIARKEETAYFKSMSVYEKVSQRECWDETGKNRIAVLWVDINKGDQAQSNYRSRLVAKEFKIDDRPEWYAATPPGERLNYE